MRRLFILPFLAVVFACIDDTPIAPELAVSPEAGLLQKADPVKMVPYRGHGTVAVVGMATGCMGDDGLLSITVAIQERATHTGHSTIAMTNCWTPAMEFVETDTGVLTAANGDLLFVRGSYADYGTVHPFYPDGSWAFGPLHFVGGTGRFEGAIGWFEAWGEMDASGMLGTVFSEGWISSVGSIK